LQFKYFFLYCTQRKKLIDKRAEKWESRMIQSHKNEDRENKKEERIMKETDSNDSNTAWCVLLLSRSLS
jgi:hypothetical protein